jgi:hypothetical protein
VVMTLHADPDASLGMAAGFIGFAAVFATITVALYRPLFAGVTAGPGRPTGKEILR